MLYSNQSAKSLKYTAKSHWSGLKCCLFQNHRRMMIKIDCVIQYVGLCILNIKTTFKHVTLFTLKLKTTSTRVREREWTKLHALKSHHIHTCRFQYNHYKLNTLPVISINTVRRLVSIEYAQFKQKPSLAVRLSVYKRQTKQNKKHTYLSVYCSHIGLCLGETETDDVYMQTAER